MPFDGSGNLYIADAFNNRVRRVSPGGTITTFAGTGTAGYLGDGGPATSAQINFPEALAVDPAGSVYAAELYNHCIRRTTAAGIISTLPATAPRDTRGMAGRPRLRSSRSPPASRAMSQATSTYPIPATTSSERSILPVSITTIAGVVGEAGYARDGGPATSGLLNGPLGLAFDAAGVLYVADYSNNVVRALR